MEQLERLKRLCSCYLLQVDSYKKLSRYEKCLIDESTFQELKRFTINDQEFEVLPSRVLCDSAIAALDCYLNDVRDPLSLSDARRKLNALRSPVTNEIPLHFRDYLKRRGVKIVAFKDSSYLVTRRQISIII